MAGLGRILGALVAASTLMLASGAGAQEVKHYRFAYDQPKSTGYGLGASVTQSGLYLVPTTIAMLIFSAGWRSAILPTRGRNADA